MEERSLCPTKWGSQLIPPSKKCSNVVGENGLSMPGLSTASMSNCEFSQLNYVFEIGQSIAASVHVLSSHTGAYFLSHFMCFLLVRVNWNSR